MQVPKTFESAATLYQREASQGIQYFEGVAPGQLESDCVGRPLKHLSADKQVTGEAVYCDDMPLLQGILKKMLQGILKKGT